MIGQLRCVQLLLSHLNYLLVDFALDRFHFVTIDDGSFLTGHLRLREYLLGPRLFILLEKFVAVLQDCRVEIDLLFVHKLDRVC